jgi:hypothetical protein
MERDKVIYLSGRISGNENYKQEFALAEEFLKPLGFYVINPAELDEVAEG